jgi:hypothetical protein
MGCDIHVHTEVKIGGEWHHLGHPNIGRNYSLFSKMAGVRNYSPEETPLAEPRGLPEDATFLTKFDYKHMGADAHTPSWLDGEEIDKLDEWYRAYYKQHDPDSYHYIEREFGYVFGNGWNVKKFPSDNWPGVEDARWIFWFDN